MKKAFLVLLIGIAASFTVFAFVKQWEEAKRLEEFQIRAQGHTASIRAGFEAIAKQLEDMRFLIEFDINNEHENPKEPQDFMSMLSPIIIHEPAIIDIDWAIPTSNQRAEVIYSWKDQNKVETHHIQQTLRPLSAYLIRHDEQGKHLQLIAPITNRINAIDADATLQGSIIAWLVS